MKKMVDTIVDDVTNESFEIETGEIPFYGEIW